MGDMADDAIERGLAELESGEDFEPEDPYSLYINKDDFIDRFNSTERKLSQSQYRYNLRKREKMAYDEYVNDYKIVMKDGEEVTVERMQMTQKYGFLEFRTQSNLPPTFGIRAEDVRTWEVIEKKVEPPSVTRKSNIHRSRK